MSDPTITTVVLCEDIRREVNGKDILIGVYGGNIEVAHFPATISIAYWMNMVPAAIGDLSISFRVSLLGKKPFGLTLKGHANSTDESSLSLPSIVVEVEEKNTLILEMKTSEGWKKIKEKHVCLRPSLPSLGNCILDVGCGNGDKGSDRPATGAFFAGARHGC